MKFVVAWVFALIAVSSANLAPPSHVPHLRTRGNQIVTASGQPVVLRGVNVMRSEWELSMEWERQAIPHFATVWRGNLLLRGYSADAVSNPAFSWTSSWGQQVTHAQYLAWLDEYVALAEQYRLYIIFAPRSAGINGALLEKPTASSIESLRVLAARYNGNPHVLFAALVEPHNVEWPTLRPLLDESVEAVRETGNQAIVMAPGTNWSRDVHWAITDPVAGSNVVYKTHPYNAPSEFQQLFLDAYDAGLPVFIGEFGSDTDMTHVGAILDLARQRNIGYAAWMLDAWGEPNLLAGTNDGHGNFTPSDPYGITVKADMQDTPPLPSDIEVPVSSRMYLPQVID